MDEVFKYHPAFVLEQTDVTPVQDKHPSIVVQSVQVVISPVAGSFKNPYLHAAHLAPSASQSSHPAIVQATQESLVAEPLGTFLKPERQVVQSLVTVANGQS